MNSEMKYKFQREMRGRKSQLKSEVVSWKLKMGSGKSVDPFAF